MVLSWSVVVARLTTLLPPRSKVKPEAVNAVASSWWWSWRRPKHVERHKTSSNKLVKLLHLVGWFIWRKSGFCVCTITFQSQSTKLAFHRREWLQSWKVSQSVWLLRGGHLSPSSTEFGPELQKPRLLQFAVRTFFYISLPTHEYFTLSFPLTLVLHKCNTM